MSNCKKCLSEFSNKDILDDPDDRMIFINEFDLVLSKLVKAGIEDGIKPINMVRALLNYSLESLVGEQGIDRKAASEKILQEALKLHNAFDDVTPDA